MHTRALSAIPSPVATVRGAGGSATSLPIYLDELIGRQVELGRLRAWLDDGERLIVIVGAPGIGKTRLATELGKLSRNHGQVVWSCDLTEARYAGDIVQAMAQSIAARIVPGTVEEQAHQLGRAMALKGRAVFIVDNAEHLIAESRDLIEGFLVDAQQARFVVTSRERLGVPGERVLELGPLSHSAQSLPADAVSLLIARVRRAGGSELWEKPGGMDALCTIAHLLDGVPLAMELAAPRLRIMSPEELAAQLHARFDVLEHASPRWDTLSQAIDWSWRMLSPIEQTVLAQCSVFRGGFSMQAALGVVDLSELPSTQPLVDIVQSLRDKSLLRGMSDGSSDPVRLGFYLTIRAFAEQRLTQLKLHTVSQHRHAAFFAALAERIESTAGPTMILHVPSELEREEDNLLAAFEWCLRERHHNAQAVRWSLALVLSLHRIFLTRGPLDRHLELLDRALEGLPKAVDPPLLAAVHLGRSRALRCLRLEALATADETIALEQATLGKNAPLRARVLCSMALGALQGEPGSTDKARGLLVEALDLQTRENDRHGQVLTRILLGWSSAECGHDAEAMETFEQAEREAATLPARGLRESLLIYRGIVHHGFQRLPAAELAYVEAMKVAEGTASNGTTAMCLGMLGILRLEQGDLPAARELLSSACEKVERWDLRLRGLFEGFRAAACALEGDLPEARDAMATTVAAIGDHPLLRHTYSILTIPLQVANRQAAGTDLDQARSAAVLAIRAATAFEGVLPWDIRVPARIVRRALGLTEPPPSDANSPTAAPTILTVQRRGDWFELAPGERISLERRASLRRVLSRLAEARVRTPKEPVPFSTLVAAGWPGERILERAGRSRLHVAISTLRRLGLRDLIHSNDSGYLLDPSVEVIVAEL